MKVYIDRDEGNPAELSGAETILALGPLTTVARAWEQGLLKETRSILVMGGSAAWGDVTPAAEGNVFLDPEAAETVFHCGLDVTMCGLDVLRKFAPSDKEIHMPLRQMVGELYLERPELFRTVRCGVHVETEGTVARGKTVTDIDSDKKFPDRDITVVLDVVTDGAAQ